MSTFLDAAVQVLEDSGEPLTAHEITKRAIAAAYLASSGATPSQTMKAKLSTDIVNRDEASAFMRTAPGQFGLRRWKRRGLREYIAERQTKSLLAEEALVFPAARLPAYAPGVGLWPISPSKGQELLDLCIPMPRWRAEQDQEVIQLVSGFVVQHAGRVLTYRRTRRLPESRLHGEFSAMFGGHLNPEDIPIWNIFQSENASFLDRELREELRLEPGRYSLSLRGVLYDNSRAVSRQHIAIVFDVDLEDPTYTVGERGFLQHDRFESWEEVGNRLDDFENWSRLLYQIYSKGGTSR